jgi:hypothetical protein
MKKLVLLTLSVISASIVTAQIQMNSNGNVGIGTTPSSSYKLNISGTTSTTYLIVDGGQSNFKNGSYPSLIIDNDPVPYGKALYPSSNATGRLGLSNKVFKEIWSQYNYLNPSDARQKENIRDIQNALYLIINLKGIKYDIKKEYAYDDSLINDEKTRAKFEEQRKNKLGFIAQDIYKVLPEVVVYDESTDIYGIDYSKVVPVLVEAIKEQQSQIDSLRQLVSSKNAISLLKGTGVISEIENVSKQDNEPYLEQNLPNPFNESTKINFYLPESNQEAIIYIYDMQGVQKKAYHSTIQGKSNVTINGSELQAGMYLYTLIIDGKEVDTKRMILTQ